MSVLVLGASGFVGSSFIEFSKIDKSNLVGFDLYGSRCGSAVLHSFFQGDVVNISSILAGCCDIEAMLYMCSSVSPHAKYCQTDLLIRELNQIDSALDFATKRKVKTFVYLSSGGTVYGSGAKYPIPESAITSPVSYYATSKLIVERVISSRLTDSGTSYKILRVANPYGVNQSISANHGVIPILLRNMQAGVTTLLRGATAIRDYIHIIDVVRAIDAAIASSHSGIYNIGTGVGTTISDLIEIVEEVTQLSPNVQYVSALPTDVDYNVLNISKASDELSWNPKIALRDGISDLWNILNDGCK